MNTFTFIIISAVAISSAYGHLSPRDLATDVPIAITETQQFEAQRVLMDTEIINWNTTYWQQSSNMNQALSLMQTEGVPTTELDSIRRDISNCNVNATNFVTEAKEELIFMQDMVADILWDLENNYLDDLFYDNDLLNQSLIEMDRVLNDYNALIVPQLSAIENKVITALISYDTPGATQARTLVNQSVAAINNAFMSVHAVHGPFMTEGVEAINAVDVVVSQVPRRRITKKHIRPLKH